MTATLVAKLSGPDSINETDARFNVYGTDLGHTFEHRGRVCMVFGDTYGPHKTAPRSNALAWVEYADPADGLRITDMATDARGHARELLPARRVWGYETTVIPTYGVSLGGRMYLHYMSVRYWGRPGRWRLRHAGLASSMDDGETWVRERGVRWSGRSNFGQAAIVAFEGYAYFFGIPGGRWGGVRLARVPEDAVLDARAYRYWDGERWGERERERAARTLAPPPVGELSVRWNAYLGKWLMLSLNERRRAVVVRTADALTGPWGEERVVATAAEFPGLYAPYILPRPPHSSAGPELFFTLSLWGPYNVYLMRTTLGTDAGTM